MHVFLTQNITSIPSVKVSSLECLHYLRRYVLLDHSEARGRGHKNINQVTTFYHYVPY